MNKYLNDDFWATVKKYYKEFIGVWALFAFFIILNSVISFNDTNKEQVNIYQTTEVKILDMYRDGQLMKNDKAPVFYHVALPTGKNLRIHIENAPTHNQIKTGKGSKLAVTESNPWLRVGQKITLYEVSVLQAGKRTTSVYATNLATAKAQQTRLTNTRKQALWTIVINTIQYLLLTALIVAGGGLLANQIRKNNSSDDDSDGSGSAPLVANTTSAYVQLPKN
ncbi:hypothetical protein [Periweissella fabalis]|uniref:Uncharacterized protein n=1 Tax=Periweissella fabalis TaxID=1070421 RepID=A0A7X6S2U3_9LACO|nr:hypothetical protein [Periweissella fabalis]MCM0599062.1 hypothetical protein [Periweissella fabalis]NKZ23342.1 hypothetical protein [Periweissella fabalis]